MMDSTGWASNVNSVLNDVAQILRGWFRSSPTCKPGAMAYFATGVTEQSLVEYCGNAGAPAFFYSIATGKPFDPSLFETPSAEPAEGAAVEPEAPAPVAVTSQPTAERSASLAVCCTAALLANGTVGPLQAAVSNELRSGGAPNSVQGKLNRLKFCGTARFARTQDNAFASESTKRGGPVGQVVRIKEENPELFVTIVRDNVDRVTGNSVDGSGDVHLINGLLVLQNKNGDPVKLPSDSTTTTGLKEKGQAPEDHSSDREPSPHKTNPTLASKVRPPACRARARHFVFLTPIANSWPSTNCTLGCCGFKVVPVVT